MTPCNVLLFLLLDNGATGSASYIQTRETVQDTYDEIIKDKTPRMINLITNPDSLAIDLWSADFIGDQTKDDITTTPRSNMAKSSKLLHEVYVYFKECNNDRKKMQEFCDIMKKNCNPGINRVLEEIQL